MTPTPKLTGDASQLVDFMRKASAKLRVEAFKVTKDASIETAQELIKHSFPAPGNNPLTGQGNTVEAKKQGEYNVRKDIESMFIPLDDFRVADLVLQKNRAVFSMNNPIEWRSEGLRKAWENQDMDTLYNAFSRGGGETAEDWDEQDYQEKAKMAASLDYLGSPSVQAQRSMMSRGRWDRQSKAIVDNRAVVEKFIMQRLQSVGKSVNGWIDCLRQLGGRANSVMPARGQGTVKMTVSPEVQITFSNPNGDPNGMLSATGAFQKVEQIVAPSFQKKAEEMLDRVFKKGWRPPPLPNRSP